LTGVRKPCVASTLYPGTKPVAQSIRPNEELRRATNPSPSRPHPCRVAPATLDVKPGGQHTSETMCCPLLYPGAVNKDASNAPSQQRSKPCPSLFYLPIFAMVLKDRARHQTDERRARGTKHQFYFIRPRGKVFFLCGCLDTKGITS